MTVREIIKKQQNIYQQKFDKIMSQYQVPLLGTFTAAVQYRGSDAIIAEQIVLNIDMLLRRIYHKQSAGTIYEIDRHIEGLQSFIEKPFEATEDPMTAAANQAMKVAAERCVDIFKNIRATVHKYATVL